MNNMAKILLAGLGLITVALLAVVAYVVFTPNDSGPSSGLLSNQSRMEKHEIVDAVEREAVCNDGSPAVYFHRPADEGFEDKWVVWFEGGGGCLDAEDCAQRWKETKHLMTSTTAGRFTSKDGILSEDSTENPDFHQWNHLMLNYCSSDNWTGDAVYEGDRTWYFKGKSIVQAAFEDFSNPDLFENPMSEASQVLITGTSAGGGGASQNMNDIASWLPEVDVRGVIDSSWEVEFPSLTMTEEELQEFSNEVIEFRGSQVNSECLADNPGNPAACQHVSNVYEYFTVPVFIYIDQYDRKKLTSRFGITDPDDPEQRELANGHAEAIRDSLQGLDGVFSPQVTFHGTITNDRFNSVLIDGYSFQEILGNWLFDREGPTALIQE